MDQISQLGKFDLKDCLFVFENISPENRYLIRGEHTKLIISNGIEAIFFNNNQTLPDKIRAVYSIDANEFNGNKNLQIIIKSIVE